jgi:hypothetical protein
VPGVVRVKRYRVDITLDFAIKEVAGTYGPKLREAGEINETRYTSTLYPINASDCEKHLKHKTQVSIRKWCTVPRLKGLLLCCVGACTYLNPAPSCLVFGFWLCICVHAGIETWNGTTSNAYV